MMYGAKAEVDREDKLIVVSGAQRGAQIELEGGTLCIGADKSCDIFLLREEVGSRVLTVSAAENGGLTLAVDGDIATVGRRTLRPGAARRVSRLVPIGLGKTELMVAGSLAEADRARRTRERRASTISWAASIAIAVGASGAVAFTTVGADRPDSVQLASLNPGGSTNAVLPVLAAQAMRDRLDSLGLAGLDVQADRNDGLVSVEGALRDSEQERWVSTQQWFDATYGAAVQLEAHIVPTVEAVTLPFAIESIWMAPTPRLILHDGSRSRVGDRLPGGWRLDAIETGSVSISRDGETLVLSL